LRSGTSTRFSNKHLGRKKGTRYFNLAGRPRGRSVDSSPSAVASCCCHSGVPKGCWRFTQVRAEEGKGDSSFSGGFFGWPRFRNMDFRPSVKDTERLGVLLRGLYPLQSGEASWCKRNAVQTIVYGEARGSRCWGDSRHREFKVRIACIGRRKRGQATLIWQGGLGGARWMRGPVLPEGD